jgi:hypothetical protein
MIPMKTIREIKHDIKNQEQILAFASFLGEEKVRQAQIKMAELLAQLAEVEKETQQ